jgi:hypothetical protein
MENVLVVKGDLRRKKGWSPCNGWPTQGEKRKSGLIVMGDLPRWKNGLIVMGYLQRKKDGLIVMDDPPKWKKERVVSL